MIMQKITFYSIVKDDVVKKALFLGTLKATFGLILMFFGGPFAFIPAVLCIGWGLIPYRKLKKQQTIPNTLDITEDFIRLNLTGKKSKIILLDQIKKLEYVENQGILFFLEESSLFAPYFSKRVFDEINEIFTN